jgi:tRNA 2-selenouridine synthase SelU
MKREAMTVESQDVRLIGGIFKIRVTLWQEFIDELCKKLLVRCRVECRFI